MEKIISVHSECVLRAVFPFFFAEIIHSPFIKLLRFWKGQCKKEQYVQVPSVAKP